MLDEVSMIQARFPRRITRWMYAPLAHALQAEFLDWLDLYVRDIRKRPEVAFGGIQLIFAGDFLQVLQHTRILLQF